MIICCTISGVIVPDEELTDDEDSGANGEDTAAAAIEVAPNFDCTVKPLAILWSQTTLPNYMPLLLTIIAEFLTAISGNVP